MEVTVTLVDGHGTERLPSLPADAYDVAIRTIAEPPPWATEAQAAVDTSVIGAGRAVAHKPGRSFNVVGGEHVLVNVEIADAAAVVAPG